MRRDIPKSKKKKKPVNNRPRSLDRSPFIPGAAWASASRGTDPLSPGRQPSAHRDVPPPRAPGELRDSFQGAAPPSRQRQARCLGKAPHTRQALRLPPLWPTSAESQPMLAAGLCPLPGPAPGQQRGRPSPPRAADACCLSASGRRHPRPRSVTAPGGFARFPCPRPEGLA